MEYRKLYEEGRQALEEIGLSDAQLDARLLLEEVCGTNLQTLLVYPDKMVSEEETGRYRDYIRRRVNREPTAMILGKWDFMGLTFRLNRSTLIPEQDTERLVEVALEWNAERKSTGIDASADGGKNEPSDQNRSDGTTGSNTAAKKENRKESRKECDTGLRILDLCTGSGCILLSLLHEIPEATGLGTDISGEALQAAEQNREALGLSGRSLFCRGDLWEPVGEERFDLIVSNPPYVPTEVIPTLEPEVRSGEPYAALDGGADGLMFYRKIIEAAQRHLNPAGTIIVESGFDEAEAIAGLMQVAGFTKIRIFQDYGGLDRVVQGNRPEE